MCSVLCTWCRFLVPADSAPLMDVVVPAPTVNLPAQDYSLVVPHGASPATNSVQGGRTHT